MMIEWSLNSTLSQLRRIDKRFGYFLPSPPHKPILEQSGIKPLRIPIGKPVRFPKPEFVPFHQEGASSPLRLSPIRLKKPPIPESSPKWEPSALAPAPKPTIAAALSPPARKPVAS